MPFAQANGIHIHYDLQGHGPNLVLITGLGYGAWFWHKLVPRLTEHFWVLTFDNRGAGQTDKSEGPYTLTMMAADTAGLLDEVGIRRAIVFGHSFGGQIAQELVWARPDLVERLILGATLQAGPKVIPATPQALAVMKEAAEEAARGDPVGAARKAILAGCPPGFAEEHPDVVQEMVEYRLSLPVPPAQYRAQMLASIGAAAMDEAEVTRRLDSIQVPTLVLDAEHDLVLPNANGPLLAEKIAGAQYLRLPACGHRYPFEAPDITARAIIDFCK